MALASLAASVAGIALGTPWGAGGIVLGAIAGVVLSALLVFIISTIVILLTRNMHRDPRALEELTSLFAARGVAISAAVAAASLGITRLR